MRYLISSALLISIAATWPARAAEPNEIFGLILGEINRQIERKQQKQQRWRLQPLVNACAKGDVAACDRATDFPNLTDDARTAISRMRTAAEQRPQYERDSYACQKMDQAACKAALAYDFASDVDRQNLQKWQQAADRQHQQERAEQDRLERTCLNGSIAACDKALAKRHWSEPRAKRIKAQRDQLRQAEEERQHQQQQRTAAVADYMAHRDACNAGNRDACVTAAAHPQVRQADVAFLKRRERELAPFTERTADLVTGALPKGIQESAFMRNALFAVLGLSLLLAVAIGARRAFSGSPSASHHDEPPWYGSGSTDTQSAPVGAQSSFSLTGHMPTDVRRALYGQRNEGSA